jgi:hypothetical protein
MHRFWDTVIEPILNRVNAKNIVEIGSDKGDHTKKILGYCKSNGGKLYSIDPFPSFDVSKLQKEYGASFEFLEDLSLHALPLIETYDAVLIDGDHNWYTVYHELKLIEKSPNFPIVFFHDVGWPYGKRDMYYNPDAIPSSYLRPHKKLGISLDMDHLDDSGLFNQNLYNALNESGGKNGVLTAIEDFVKESKLGLHLYQIPFFNGLGVLVPKEHEINNDIIDILLNQQLLVSVERDRVNKEQQTLKLLKRHEQILANVTQLMNGMLHHRSRLHNIVKRNKIKQAVIFGTDQIGLFLLNELTLEGVEVKAFLDNNKLKQGTALSNVGIYDPSWIRDHSQRQKVDAIFLSIKGEHYKSIIHQLHEILGDLEIPIYSLHAIYTDEE